MASSNKNPIAVMITGQPRKGKSTALNNMFGLHLPAGPSPYSLTKKFTVEKVDRAGITLLIIDTPGLGSLDLPSKTVMADITRHSTGLDFTLIYCLPVSPSDGITETDRHNINILGRHFPTTIWNKCIVLLTSSDIAKMQEFKNDDKGYIDYLRGHTKQFQDLLRKNGITNEVSVIFDRIPEGMSTASIADITTGKNEIVAVPVARDPTADYILPGISLKGVTSWTDLAYEVLLKRVDPRDVPKFLDFRYATFAAGSGIATAASGAVLGATVGAGLGLLEGPLAPITVPLGATAGGIIGGFTGLASGMSVSTVVQYFKWKNSNPDKKLTELLEESLAPNKTIKETENEKKQ